MSRPLLVVVVVCTVHLCATQWPCPDSDDISPCICTTTADLEIDIDCSEIYTHRQLVEIFETPFPFNDLRKFTLRDTNDDIYELPANVFGDKTFEEIEIAYTNVGMVDEEALVNSQATLRVLNLPYNLIYTFPLETLNLFTVLQMFDISYNYMVGPLPDIVSESLISLNMSGNKGITLTESTFVGAPYVEDLRLNDIGLSETTPANVFHSLMNLRTLHLNYNNISGTLVEDFINNELNSLTSVQLIGNFISSIHPLAVTGMNSSGSISFKSNQIQYLPQEEWGNLASSLTQANAIDMTTNPLVCGCDLLWLVLDSTLMSKFDENTMCVTGNYIADLPQNWYMEHCP